MYRDNKEIIENINYVIGQACLSHCYSFSEFDEGRINFWFDHLNRILINNIKTAYTVDDLAEINFESNSINSDNNSFVKILFDDNTCLRLFEHGIEMKKKNRIFHNTKAILHRMNYDYRVNVLGEKVNPIIIIDREVVAFCGNAYNCIIPEGVTQIGEYAFEYSDIYIVSFPSSIHRIRDYAFYKCANLRSLKFSEENEYIGFEVLADDIIKEQIPENIDVDLKKAFIGSDHIVFC